MPSLRDKLRATQGAPKRSPAPPKAAPQDCYVLKSRFQLKNTFLADGVLPLMQGDVSLPTHVELFDFVFLDTETTGLSRGAGTVAFLVGVGEIKGNDLHVTQYLMRDYDEESFVLRHVMAHLQPGKILVTYNGRTFDIPLLASRFIMQRIRFDAEALPHVDLLHTARRVWKLRLQRCSLSALEEHIYNEPRVDDLPGAEVPQRYFDYLKSRDFSLLDDILRHNAQDIATLARLLFTLSELHMHPLSAEHVQDIYSLGRVYEKRGRNEDARICYRASDAGSMSALSRARLADNFRRCRDTEAAAAIYQKMISARQGGAAPYIALSKLQEHKLRDIPAALEAARRGLLLLSDRTLDARSELEFNDLTHRYARLLEKSKNINKR